MAILESINNPMDLQKLNNKELNTLAGEIRETIIKTVDSNGGHLASNLGIVETTIAICKEFNLPTDKVIFDVGHQCYTYKLLTGRRERFSTLRTDGGISGFPDSNESEYDTFIEGHAGTSISQAIGLCMARDKLGLDYYVVVVVGDGSVVNGLNLEAISMSNYKPKKLIVILNDNGMSISKNTNGLYHYIGTRRLSKFYIKSKVAVKKILGSSILATVVTKTRNAIKNLFKQDSIFEEFGFSYVGVMNGNDIKEMSSTLEKAKYASQHKAILLHINTTKGKGYTPSEKEADVFHGIGRHLEVAHNSFSDTLGDKLNSLIEKDKKIVAIVAGMENGTGLKVVDEKNHNNFIDVGIAEDLAVTLSSGLAKGGLKPVVAIYSTFMQRAYDQIIHDVCIQNLPVVFCLDRAGLSGADGVTHNGVFDLSYLLHLPRMTVLCPCTPDEMEGMIDYAFSLKSPVAIRYPTGSYKRDVFIPIEENFFHQDTTGRDLNIIYVGPRMKQLAEDVASNSEKKIGLIEARVLKPLDTKFLDRIAKKPMLVLEENAEIGGFASYIENYYMQNNISAKVIPCGIKDEFVNFGSLDAQYKTNDLTIKKIIKKIDEIVK